ncbi:MAG: S23 ribosomal protein [Parcubacteria group bacterium GW2011_GWA2_43_9b]|nr:MAG: S23 ribosomal protein [Parcubacteria group bacterium GW2011_GWA2_43_9b]
MGIEPKRNIKLRADSLARDCYKLTEKFPKEELYVLTSQLRRAILSVPANIIEGYDRQRRKLFVNHLEIAYASLAEAKYFIYFAYSRQYMKNNDYEKIIKEADEVSRMLWASIVTISAKID